MAYLPAILDKQRKEQERRDHHNGLIADAAEHYRTVSEAYHAHADNCGLCRLSERSEDVTCPVGVERLATVIEAEESLFALIDQRK